MRLPPRPNLTWKDDGTPVDPRIDDVYYSVEDGLAETRAVFLNGCGLPDRWEERRQFTIAELGFGTGLNFLATWQMWRAHRRADGWLHFVSFEGFPLEAEDIERALQPWPELNDLTAQLVRAWPPRAKGIRHITWPDERLSLTLHIGLIEETLPQSQFRADAWFLDGFSPAKNSAMWADTLWPLIAERSAEHARAATFTVAGAVRRGLASVGFEVYKRPGHGRKRERLEAMLSSASSAMRPATVAPPKVAIIGAGIAGACLADRLKTRGATVTLFDRADGPAEGTSGNPLALVMPRLDASDTAQARLLIDAYLNAQAFYDGRPGAAQAETVHRPRDDTERTRFGKVLADPPLGLEQLEALSGDGLLHKGSQVLSPPEVLRGLLQAQTVRWRTEADIEITNRTVNGERFDAIILAAGWQAESVFADLDLTPRLGQIEYVESDVDAPPAALASGHYAIAAGHKRLWGATFADHPGGPPETRDAAQDENLMALEALAPYWWQESKRKPIISRAGIRATTADRLPLIGPAPDHARLAENRSVLERAQWKIDFSDYSVPGLYIAGGYGSRGFTWAPWAASILTAEIFGDPRPARIEALRAIVPIRQVLRRLKRRQT
ncbi:MAG: tRNA (5-methylaminomethyl-2-thiouridine)(34)-methyltransferase MnmD [Pseudomonadota bacterium]